MKTPFLRWLFVLSVALGLPIFSLLAFSQEEPGYSVWSLWLGSHYTGYEDFSKKVGEFDRGKEGAVPEISLSFSGYQKDKSLDFFGHYYDPKRISFSLTGKSKDILSGLVSYRSFYRQRATDLLENLMAREATNQAADTPGGKMFTYEHENPDADFGYTRHEIKSDFQVKVPGSAKLKIIAAHRSILEKGDDQKVVSMHCSSCHMVSKSAKVDRRTHTASAGIEIDPGPLFLSYMGSFRSFKSESPSLEAFYDTAQHPVNGTMIEEFGSRMVFDGEVVEFGTIPETQKMSHTAKVKADVGKKSEILGSFTYSQAKNVSAGIETKSNGGSLKYMFRPNLKTRIIALASLSRIESDAVFIDLPSWREGREGGSQDFDWTRYSNLTRTVAKGSAEFIYQPSRKYRVFLSAGYEGTKRDDYPYFEAEGKTTKLKLSMGGKYRPHLRFSGRFKYFFENTDDPFSPYEQLFERAGNTILDTLPGNTKYYYFQRDQLRYGSITNQPTNLHGVELNLNFRPNHKVSFSADLKASLGTNSDTDSLDFERTRLQPQVSANFAPTAKWNLFSSLTYIYEKSNGLVAVAMMDG